MSVVPVMVRHKRSDPKDKLYSMLDTCSQAKSPENLKVSQASNEKLERARVKLPSIYTQKICLSTVTK